MTPERSARYRAKYEAKGFIQTIVRGYGWRLGGIAAAATVAALFKVFA